MIHPLLPAFGRGASGRIRVSEAFEPPGGMLAFPHVLHGAQMPPQTLPRGKFPKLTLS